MSREAGMLVADVGDVLAGKYRVDRVLGVGGMGMVVAATHLELDQRVAVKFMLAGSAASAPLMERFLREARAVVRLRGENVCRVFDVGRLATGAPYIVMEMMDGEDLGAVILASAPLPVERAIALLLQALEGVAEAHAHGIVHRDLKPANLFVTTSSDGSPLVKVLDFGISKTPIDGSPPATRTGDVMGSPAYMAPEQMMSSKAVDARADVWSLGIILYQMLSARLPWTQESLPALCMSVMSDPAPPLPAALPAALAAVVMRCLAKDRGDRYADVAELAAAIGPFGPQGSDVDARRIANVLHRRAAGQASVEVECGIAATLPVTATEPPTAVKRKRTRWPFAVGIVAISTVIVGAKMVSSTDDPPTPMPVLAPVSAALPSALPVPAPRAPPIATPSTVNLPASVAAPRPVAPVLAAHPSAAKPAVRTQPLTVTRPATIVASPPQPTPPPVVVPPSDVKPADEAWSRMQHDKP